jgi:hypothetical protein
VPGSEVVGCRPGAEDEEGQVVSHGGRVACSGRAGTASPLPGRRAGRTIHACRSCSSC